MAKRKRASSCNVKLARIRAILRSRTPKVLAIAEIEAVVSGRKVHWRR